MSFFIADAWAQEGGGAASAGWIEFIPLILLFVIFYFLLIRPQQKRAKEHRELVAAIAKGDEVVTSGGMVGRVTGVTDDFVTLQVGNGVELRFQKQSVAATLPKGTLKKLDEEHS